MSPKIKSLNLFSRFVDKKKKMNKNMKKRSNKLKLRKSAANKILYICYVERHPENRVSYVVRSIELAHLLRSGDDSVDHQLKEVGHKIGDEHLPSCVGCGLYGSQIVFAAGITPATLTRTNSSTYQKDVYAFETDPEKQHGGSSILKMDAKLVNGKYFPMMVVLGGKLCALSFQHLRGAAFEVFDHEINTWRKLPRPPFWDLHCSSWHSGYAITGTKMFISYGTSPVYCFDIAQEDKNWRRVDSMSGPFPFNDEALVLDLPGHRNKKLVFGCNYLRPHWKLGVYIMFLDEGRESITQVADMELPALPRGFDFAGAYHPLHIGGQKGCLVAPHLSLPYGEGPRCGEVGSHKITGVALPFKFHLDFNKMVDEDVANCFTLNFFPTRVFESCTTPSTFPDCGPEACFIL